MLTFFICIFISVSQTWASDYRRDIVNLLYIENCHSIQELNKKASGNLSTPYPSTIKLAPDAENILIEAGSVIYYPYQFNDLNRIAEALSKEDFAQERLAGCWGSDTYKTISADHDIHTGQFHIVEGTVQDVGESFENIFLNFGADWKTDFTVRIEKSNKNFDGYDFQSLKGQHLQVRGFVESYNGPSLTLTHPALIRGAD